MVNYLFFFLVLKQSISGASGNVTRLGHKMNGDLAEAPTRDIRPKIPAFKTNTVPDPFPKRAKKSLYYSILLCDPSFTI